MLDQFFESPFTAIGFVIFVVYLGGLYILNRERQKVAQMRGPRRFEPKWSNAASRRRQRRGRGSGTFSPDWTSRTPVKLEGADSKREDGGDPGPGDRGRESRE